MTRNRIDAIEAAVERVTEAIGVLSVLSCDLRNGMRFHQATTSLRGIQLGEALAAHIDTALIALAEANERASLLQTALAASEARRGELEAKAKAKLGVGMVIAAQIGFSSHGCSVTAEEILCCAGLDTAEKMRRIGVDKYDIERLRPVLRDIAQRKRNNRAKRLNPQQEGSRDHG